MGHVIQSNDKHTAHYANIAGQHSGRHAGRFHPRWHDDNRGRITGQWNMGTQKRRWDKQTRGHDEGHEHSLGHERQL
eukprot:12912416-Prorocentrum_lima.AAC.1